MSRVRLLTFVVVASTAVGVAVVVEPRALLLLAGGSAVAFATMHPKPEMRLAVVLFLLVSNLLYFLHLPRGAFLALLLLFLLRDLQVVAAFVRPMLAPAFLLMAYIALRAPTRYGLGVAVGLWTLLYVRAVIDADRPALLVHAGALGAVVGTAANLKFGGDRSDYFVYSNGALVEVRRAVDAAVDPNAFAVALTFGLACLLYLRRERHAKTALVAPAALFIAGGIAASGSRSAIAFAALTLAAATAAFRQGRKARIGAAIVAAGGGLFVMWLVLSRTNLFVRFTELGRDDSVRLTIWRKALSAILSSAGHVLFGFGAPSTLTTPHTPHNSVLEIADAFGVVGLFLIAVLLLLAFSRTTLPSDSVLKVGIFAVIGVALLVGMSATYLPWFVLGLRAPNRDRTTSRQPATPSVEKATAPRPPVSVQLT